MSLVFQFHECYPYGMSSHFTTIYSFMNICITSVIPFIILLILNGVIIVTIQKRKSHFPQKTQEITEKQDNISSNAGRISKTGGKAQGKNQDRQLTTMLLSVSFALLGLTLPQCINHVYNSSFKLKVTPDPLKYYGTYALIDVIANRVFSANNAINFFLYCITGSKFRQDLMKLMPCSK